MAVKRALPLPLTVINCNGISATRRERIEAAAEAAGQRLAQPYRGWIAADRPGAASGFSLRGGSASSGRSRSRATKRWRRSRSESERR
jgi:hypothetical protein